MTKYKIINDDVLSYTKTIKDNIFHSVFCDPPYALVSNKNSTKGFMNNEWDAKIPSVEIWNELLRVSRPGAFIMAFGGTKTQHRLICNIEDAGWKIITTLDWIYGSGFPKGHKTEVEGWGGYKTPALKPAHEIILLAQKPIEGNYSENIIKWGCGLLNINGTRIPTDDNVSNNCYMKDNEIFVKYKGNNVNYNEDWKLGRYPADILIQHHPECKVIKLEDAQISYSEHERSNATVLVAGGLQEKPSMITTRKDQLSNEYFCHPDCPANQLNERGGITEIIGKGLFTSPHKNSNIEFGSGSKGFRNITQHGDKGPVSRYFKNFYYCKKTSTKEREAGCDLEYDTFVFKPNGVENYSDTKSTSVKRKNNHSCVKPIELNTYLATLILPPPHIDSHILNPFAGSGSEGIGALLAGWQNITIIEREKDYCQIASDRMKYHSVNKN